MGEVLNMNNIKNGNTNTIEWEKVGTKVKDGEVIYYPLKVWQNLRCILEKNNIQLRLNLVSHDIDYVGIEGELSRNSKFTDIYTMQIEEGLNLNRDETMLSIKRIAELNAYNPFVDMLKENENSDFTILQDVFNVLELENEEEKDFYFKLFIKWCLNVVKMSQNTLEKDLSGQGVLVLQGSQGCYKSTFCRKLIPLKGMYKGDKSLDPEKTDSVMQNTRYIVVEWGELDSTLKGEQAKLKQFITSTNDEYRSPYDRLSEKYPRLTSYMGTVNTKGFLKDETGSRRFWIIPIKRCNHEMMDCIDLKKFWGAIYAMWKQGNVIDYLTSEDQMKLHELNKSYNFSSDVSITIDEGVDWTSDKSTWQVYNVSEICQLLCIREKKSVANEMTKRDIPYKVYRLSNGKTKKGYKIPRIINDVY